MRDWKLGNTENSKKYKNSRYKEQLLLQELKYSEQERTQYPLPR